jgi:hypothetical protein
VLRSGAGVHTADARFIEVTKNFLALANNKYSANPKPVSAHFMRPGVIIYSDPLGDGRRRFQMGKALRIRLFWGRFT